MRTLMALAALVAALSLGAGDARAEGKYWPWCSRYGWTIVCAYANYQQCQAAVSGAGGACQLNVMGPPAGYDAPRRYRKHRSSHRY